MSLGINAFPEAMLSFHFLFYLKMLLGSISITATSTKMMILGLALIAKVVVSSTCL